MEHQILESYVVESHEQGMALMNPFRAEMLTYLREPSSASEVARAMNEQAQRVNYHLKALEKVGLVRRVGTRNVRNLVEVLYQALARTFILADQLGWNADTVQKMKDQSSLAHLVAASTRLKQDALRLMEVSDEGEEVPSASLQLQIHLTDEKQREAFVREYVETMKKLAEKYQGSGEGVAYQVLAAVYPEPDTDKGGSET